MPCPSRSLSLVCAAGLLTGCLDAGEPAGPDLARGLLAAPAAPATTAPPLVEAASLEPTAFEAAYAGPFDPRLVARPGLFEARATLRWRGERTLPGVWIAHPATTTHARVRLINPATGRAADAAMVPHVAATRPQISQAAAEALALSRFGESEILIVAIAAPNEPPDFRIATAEDAPTDERSAPAPSETSVAAVSAPERAARAERPVETRRPSPPAATPEDTAVAVAAPEVGTNTSDAAVAEATPADADPAGTVTGPADPSPAQAAETARPEPTPEVASDARALEADAAPATPPTRLADETVAPPAPEPADEPARTAADRPRRRFVQVGVYTDAATARGVVDRLRVNGLSAEAVTGRFEGREALRVRVGPYAGAEDRLEAVDRLRRLGIEDVLFVSD